MKNILLILTFIYVLFFSLYLFPRQTTNGQLATNVDIQTIIKSKIGSDEYTTYKINNEYINIETVNTSFVINANNGETISYENLFASQYDSLNREIKSQFTIKYPKFIVNTLEKNQENKIYRFTNQGLEVIYKDYQTTPDINQNLNINITCDVLKKYIDTECNKNYPSDINEPFLDPAKPTIALTFDDGPNKNTRIVMQALLDNKMQATFFMLGQNMNQYPEIVKEVYRNKFEIGSHTYSHRYLTKLDIKDRVEELQKTNKLFNELTGSNISLTRAPYGSTNKEIRENLNTIFIQWSVDTRDWELRDAEKVINKVLNDISDGDIVLMHDIHLTTAKAVEQLLPILYVKGYQVTTVSKLAKLKGYNIEKNNLYYSFK